MAAGHGDHVQLVPDRAAGFSPREATEVLDYTEAIATMPGLVTRSIGAVRGVWNYASGPWRYGTRPPGGRIVLPSRQLDCNAGAINDGLNFTQLKSLLRAADDGNLAQGLQLFQEMERKDPTLYSVANTRRTALTGLEYEIVSAAEVQETGDQADLADEAAGYVRERLCKVMTSNSAFLRRNLCPAALKAVIPRASQVRMSGSGTKPCKGAKERFPKSHSELPARASSTGRGATPVVRR